MALDDLLYRLSRRAKLAGMEARRGLGLGAPFPACYEPSNYRFCSRSDAGLPMLPWSSVIAITGGRVPSVETGWHEAGDPEHEWPLTFFTRIAHPPGNPTGDVQVTWTRSRLQELVTLGLLCRESTSEDIRRASAATIGSVLLSWIQQNPWLQGVNYQSTMECALRLMASCHALDLARAYMTSEAWQGLLLLVHGHAYFIERRLCLHSAAGNHTIGECSGLIYAGVLFPEFKDARRWVQTGLLHLEREADAQVLADGGNRERSFRYLAMITDLLGLVTVLLANTQRSVPRAIEQAAMRAKAFLRSFADSPETLPNVGDSDDTYALSPYLRLSWQPQADECVPLPRLQRFDATGYSKISAGAGHGTMHFIHGPLGLASGFGHGHADALSVWWERGGRPILVDPGTYLYEGDAMLRRYFRGTAAHNTIVVDGLDQAQQVPGSTFGWSRPYRAELVDHDVQSDGRILLLARHDGYAHLGVTHWRSLVYCPTGGWTICDRLEGTSEHLLELHWHVDAPLVPDGDGFIIADGKMHWRLAVDGGVASVYRGDESTPLGWISRRYGTREPLSTIKVSLRTTLPHRLLTTITPIPREDDSAPLTRT